MLDVATLITRAGTALGLIGGGGNTNPQAPQSLAKYLGYAQNAGSPVSAVTPDHVGQIIFDTSNSNYWIAYGAANTAWVLLASSTTTGAGPGNFSTIAASGAITGSAGITGTTLTTTAGSLASGADPLAVTALAAAQGGAITITGGTSSTSANAGGAVTLAGGTPGATGNGGAANLTGGIGGATSGTGGAATVTGGAGTTNAAGGVASLIGGAGNGTGAGAAVNVTGGASGAGATGNGGASSITGGAATSTNGTGGAASLVGGLGTGTGTGGAITITSGAAGATGVAGAVNISVGAATAGAGSNLTITGGNGAGGTAAGGNVNLVPGTAVSTGTPGEIQVNSAAGLYEADWFQPLSTTATPSTGSIVPFFIANRAYRVKAVRVKEVTVGTSETLTFHKDPSGTAAGSGTAILTGAITLGGSSNNVPIAGSLVTTVASLTMAAGDSLSFTIGGTVGSAAGLGISVMLVPC